MLKTILAGCVLSCYGLMPLPAQSPSTPLESYFLGKKVAVKLDMPGTQQGVDLNFDKSAALDWNSYSSRVKNFGVSLHKGDVARVTKFVVKKDQDRVSVGRRRALGPPETIARPVFRL